MPKPAKFSIGQIVYNPEKREYTKILGRIYKSTIWFEEDEMFDVGWWYTHTKILGEEHQNCFRKLNPKEMGIDK